MSDIHIILTGGTIEKIYDPLTEKPELRQNPVLPSYLQTVIKPYPNLSFDIICQIDSVDFTDKIRASIVQAVKRASGKQIVIVHGTSTMAVTAQYLKQHLEGIDKTVILTGSMIPLKEFAMSDGGFNMGYAIAQAQIADPGVYIAMNAQLFEAGTATKNTASGRFESV